MTAETPYMPDSPAAKLWELLRRNPRFREDVERLTRFRKDTKSPVRRTRLRALNGASKFLREVQARNEFAHLAFQWLVPQPLFTERDQVPKDDQKAQSRGVILWRTIRLGFGVTPDTNHESWKWFNEKPGPFGSPDSQANQSGRLMRWGPEVVRWLIHGSRENSCSFDYITEWADWFARHTFTVDSAWLDAPPGFRRDWESIWRRCSGIGQRARHTDFHRGWRPSEIVARARQEIREANRYIQALLGDLDRERQGLPGTTAPAIPTAGGGRLRRYRRFGLHLSEAEEAGLIRFDFTQHRVLVELPPLLSQQAARLVLRNLESEIKNGLPKVHELLGTRRAWETCLAVEPFRERGAADLGKAMGQFFRSRVRVADLRDSGLPKEHIWRWLKGDGLRPLPSNATDAEAAEHRDVETAVSRAATEDRQRNRHLEDWVRFLDDLSAATYPTFDAKELSRKTPHRGLLGGERSQRKPKEE